MILTSKHLSTRWIASRTNPPGFTTFRLVVGQINAVLVDAYEKFHKAPRFGHALCCIWD